MGRLGGGLGSHPICGICGHVTHVTQEEPYGELSRFVLRTAIGSRLVGLDQSCMGQLCTFALVLGCKGWCKGWCTGTCEVIQWIISRAIWLQTKQGSERNVKHWLCHQLILNPGFASHLGRACSTGWRHMTPTSLCVSVPVRTAMSQTQYPS